MGKVIVERRFKEENHDGHIYNKGDAYPAYGFKAVAKRVSFLSEVHPKLGHVYLKEVEESSEEEDKAVDADETKSKNTEKSKKPADKE